MYMAFVTHNTYMVCIVYVVDMPHLIHMIYIRCITRT